MKQEYAQKVIYLKVILMPPGCGEGKKQNHHLQEKNNTKF
jgi:hypothetical protein